MINKTLARKMKEYSRIKHGVRFIDRVRLQLYLLLTLVFTWTLCYRFEWIHNFINFIVKGIQIKSMGYIWEIGHHRDFVTVDDDYEEYISDWFNHGSDVFIDVGAYVGRYSVILNNRFKKIYAFEPTWATYQRLKKNILINGIENVSALRLALMDQTGFFDMNIKYTPGTNSLLNEKNVLGLELVECCLLDDLIFNGKIDLIKIDVEGAEKMVLRGAENTIRMNKPRIIIEVEKENRLFVKSFMLALDYSEELKCEAYGGIYHCYDYSPPKRTGVKK